VGNDDGMRGYQGSFLRESQLEPDGWVDGAPTSGEFEHCAMCGDKPVAGVHPLAADARQYLLDGKGQTLPHYWMLCEWCESVSADGDDEALLRIMRPHQAFHIDDDDDPIGYLRPTLAAYRRADRGARRLAR
jgi:hypothetical protein